jgi:hypothetical protein
MVKRISMRFTSFRLGSTRLMDTLRAFTDSRRDSGEENNKPEEKPFFSPDFFHFFCFSVFVHGI